MSIEAMKQEPVACQYAVDVAMPEYRCVGKCQYTTPPAAQQEPVVWKEAEYDKVLQVIKEMRPATVALKDKPGSWWLDRFEEAVKQLKERA